MTSKLDLLGDRQPLFRLPAPTPSGLPVLNCDGCGGSCCRHMVMPPFVPLDMPGNEEWAVFQRDNPALHAELKAEYERKKAEDDWPEEGPCFWLERASGRCKHHESRPEICREFEVGGEWCLAAREHYGI